MNRKYVIPLCRHLNPNVCYRQTIFSLQGFVGTTDKMQCVMSSPPSSGHSNYWIVWVGTGDTHWIPGDIYSWPQILAMFWVVPRPR